MEINEVLHFNGLYTITAISKDFTVYKLQEKYNRSKQIIELEFTTTEPRKKVLKQIQENLLKVLDALRTFDKVMEE